MHSAVRNPIVATAGAAIVAVAVLAGPPATAEPRVDDSWTTIPGVSVSDLAVTADGRVFAADRAGSRLLRLADDGSATVAADLGPYTPLLIDTARDGSVLVASDFRATVLRVRPDGSTIRSALPEGWITSAMAQAADGSTLVFGEGSRWVARVAADGGVDPWFRDLGFAASGVRAASTPSGDVYLSTFGSGRVWRLQPDGTLGEADDGPTVIALAPGPAGSVYASRVDGSVRRYGSGSAAGTVMPSDPRIRPVGDLAVDAAGDVLLTTADSGLVELTASGAIVHLGGLRAPVTASGPDGTVYAATDA